MTRPPRPPAQAAPVPLGRLSRMLRMGTMTTGVIGDALVGGARQLASGERPSLPDLFLSPATGARLTRELGQMRGAAMKLGQMLSMDTGLVLPPAMTTALATLRADAPHMPPKQLQAVLDQAWGKGWYGRFARFDLHPFAAASIGQVHRARGHDGADLAIKVQYPGVRASIDSDLANLATLLRLPGLVPRGLDLAPLLAEARAQLHQEADYIAEAAHLARFQALLADDPAFCLPALHRELSTPEVLVMGYVHSQPIDALERAPQALRDKVALSLIDLVLRELFDFGWMQTDPNLGNYRFDPESGKVVLLDFGAVMAVEPALQPGFRRLLNAALGDSRAERAAAMEALGYFDARMPAAHQALLVDMFETAMEPLRMERPFDFGKSPLIARLRDMGLALGSERDLAHLPPPASLFLHRKIGGIYMLASRLKARVALGPLVARYR